MKSTKKTNVPVVAMVSDKEDRKGNQDRDAENRA